MSKALHIAALLLILSSSLSAQELLSPARIRARAKGKNLPSLGLPVRLDGGHDAIVRYIQGRWEGADSVNALPRWTMCAFGPKSAALPACPGAILELCRIWAGEAPRRPVDIVYGPLGGSWYVALCKKTHSVLGWKTISFVIPPEGPEEGKSIYAYSHSVNWLERRIGYNLYPRLPAYIQEIIEEMTASELLSPHQEFDPGLDERPEQEIDYDWEADYREM